MKSPSPHQHAPAPARGVAVTSTARTAPRPSRLAACADVDHGTDWRLAMSATSTTQDVIAAVLGISQQTVASLIRQGTITATHRLDRMIADPATADCVRAFCARLHARGDRRGPERERVLADLQRTIAEANQRALHDALVALRKVGA